VTIVEVEHVATPEADHQGHPVAGEPPPAVLAGFLLLELRALAQRTDKLRSGHKVTVANRRKEPISRAEQKAEEKDGADDRALAIG